MRPGVRASAVFDAMRGLMEPMDAPWRGDNGHREDWPQGQGGKGAVSCAA